jgi:polyribonucleotide nucleotidyltransferase
MADAITVSGPINGTDRTLSFETGRFAAQADGAVLARIGDTIVLVTATAARKVREGTDFFPRRANVRSRQDSRLLLPA